MIWADYDREWKKYQIEFNKLEVKLTEQQIQEALGQDRRRPQRRPLEAELAKGDAGDRGARRDEIGRPQAEVDQGSNGELVRASTRTTASPRPTIDVERFEYEEAVHKKATSAAAEEGRLENLRARTGPTCGWSSRT